MATNQYFIDNPGPGAGGSTTFPLTPTTGSASAPPYSFVSHTTSGMYYDTTNSAVAFSNAGTEIAWITATALTTTTGSATQFGVATPAQAIGESSTGFFRPATGQLGFALGGTYAGYMAMTNNEWGFYNQAANSYAAGFAFYTAKNTTQLLTLDASNGMVVYGGPIANSNVTGSSGIASKVTGSACIAYQGNGVNGQYGLLQSATALTSGLSGASVSSVAIPAGAIVLGVATRVTTTITGATTFSIGDSGSATAYGSAIALASGTTTNNSNWTITTPKVYASGDNIKLTANGSNFTAGAVRVDVFYFLCSAATT